MTPDFATYLQEGGLDIQAGGQEIRYRSEDAVAIEQSMQDFFAYRLPQLDAELASKGEEQ